jgi:hypothetical protein
MEVSGQLHAPAALPPGKEQEDRVGPRAILDVVAKRKISSPLQESNPRTLIVQTILEVFICHISTIKFNTSNTKAY